VGIALEELYNTHMYGVISKVGNTLFSTYCLSFLNPKYTEKSITKKAMEMLFEMLDNPNIKKGSFDEDSFKIVKNNLKAEIIAQKENSLGFAIRRMLHHLDKDSPSSFSVNGYLKDLDEITEENLVPFYEEVMNNDICDIYLIGNLDMDEVSQINKMFKREKNNRKDIVLYAKNKKAKKVQEVNEKDNFQQANLVVGCNIDKLTEREKTLVVHVYNVILGSGSMETKLFKYLREQNSLCYTTRSLYQKYDNLLILYAGIDPSSYKLSVDLMKKALQEMKDGVISEEELDNAKALLKSSLGMTYDNPGGLVNNYLFENLDNLPRLDVRIKEIMKVTKEEIVKVAKKVRINTIYMLSDGDEE
jgi:predicted Zn-dependent peptidase